VLVLVQHPHAILLERGELLRMRLPQHRGTCCCSCSAVFKRNSWLLISSPAPGAYQGQLEAALRRLGRGVVGAAGVIKVRQMLPGVVQG
jgi:hypothetical protein